jgi:hypothetical protein
MHALQLVVKIAQNSAPTGLWHCLAAILSTVRCQRLLIRQTSSQQPSTLHFAY